MRGQRDIGKETDVAARVQRRSIEAWLWVAEERTKERLNKYLHYAVQSLWSFFSYSILTSMESSAGFNLSQLA